MFCQSNHLALSVLCHRHDRHPQGTRSCASYEVEDPGSLQHPGGAECSTHLLNPPFHAELRLKARVLDSCWDLAIEAAQTRRVKILTLKVPEALGAPDTA